MADSRLAKVARRIGMTLKPWGDTQVWHDPKYEWEHHGIKTSDDGLRAWLTTGDRPMRIQEKGKISVLYHRDTKQWQAVCMVERDHVLHAVWTPLRATPAEAILACAMEVVG